MKLIFVQFPSSVVNQSFLFRVSKPFSSGEPVGRL